MLNTIMDFNPGGHPAWISNQMEINNAFRAGGYQTPHLLSIASQNINQKIENILKSARPHPNNKHILFVQNATDMIAIRHPSVHAVIAHDPFQNEITELVVESETEIFIRDQVMQRNIYSDLNSEEILLATFSPEEYEEQTGQLAEYSNIYSNALAFQRQLLHKMESMSKRMQISDLDINFQTGTYDGTSFPLISLKDQYAYLQNTFEYATGKPPQRSTVFLHGNGLFGNKTTDNFHVDRHEISEEDALMQAWGNMVSESEYIMLRNYVGNSTEFMSDWSEISQAELDMWEENRNGFDHDRIAEENHAEDIPKNHIALFKTTELGLNIDQVSDNVPVFVHRGPTIYPAQARMAIGLTSS